MVTAISAGVVLMPRDAGGAGLPAIHIENFATLPVAGMLLPLHS